MVSWLGRQVRQGAAGTALAALAMAALTASQAPGLASGAGQPPPGTPIDGGSPYITALPPLGPSYPAGRPKAPTGTGSALGTAGIPEVMVRAYQHAQAAVGATDPGCHLPWQLLAAIGQVESDQADEGANIDADGEVLRRILGPVLDGAGVADIPDTDGGRWDGDPLHDRAVGPMQFIPSTWATWGADGNGDGVEDPENIFDAALAAAHYLCADGRDLAVPADMRSAILGYNDSAQYLATVESWYAYFRTGVRELPDGPPGIGVLASPPHPSASASGANPPLPGPSPTPSATPSAGASSTPGQPSPSPSPSSGSGGDSGGAGGTPTSCPTPSASPSPSPSASASPSASDSTPPSGSPSPDPSGSASASPTTTPSPSPSSGCPVPPAG